MILFPEILITSGALLILFLDVALGRGLSANAVVRLGVLFILAALLACFWLMPTQAQMFGGRFVVDAVIWWFKVVFLLAAAFTFGFSLDLFSEKAAYEALWLKHPAEFFVILLFNLCGMLMLVSSTDLVSLYVSLELATAPLYMLAGWSRTLRSVEAGIKYALLGALSSAFLLLGFSIIYGLSGETSVALINANLSATPATLLAIGLILTGVAFKLALVPFHMWAPDIYQGAPTPITAYLSVASKTAGVAVLFILWFKLFRHITASWEPVIVVLSALSMTLGNIVAMVQQNIKRFMAYSSISQAGYILLGFLGPTAEGVPAMLFYLLAYLVSNFAVFGVIIFFANATGRERIKDYAGLSITNPILALSLMLGLFSLAGIPPLSGFTGKFFLFSIASKAGYHWLVALAALNSTVSLYYYLRVVRQMYIEEPSLALGRLSINHVLALCLAISVISSVALGFMPIFYESIHRQTIGYLL